MKERKKLFQKHEFCTKGKVHIMNLLDKGNVDIMDIWKKGDSFKTREVGRNIFPLQNFHDMLSIKAGDLSVLRK